MTEKRNRGRGRFAKDLTGQRFGRLLVTGYEGFLKKRAQWLCLCDCGKTSIANGPNLKRGHTVSCGCLRREALAPEKHGLSNSREYKSYQLMRARTGNPGNIGYADYGGRGIRCEYVSFEQFYADLGPKPTPRHSLGRIDNDSNYGPGNCRWETPDQQCNNKRNNIVIEFNGERMTCAQWARRLGFKRATIAHRLNHGWPTEAALTTPLGARRMRSANG